MTHSEKDDGKRFAEALFSLARSLHEYLRSRAGNPKLSVMQVHALIYIQKHPRPLMRDLAHCMGIAPASVTPLTAGLVKIGLIQRVRDTYDHRAWHLRLTEKGERLIQNRLGIISEHLRKTLKTLSLKEQTTLLHLLERIRVNE